VTERQDVRIELDQGQPDVRIELEPGGSYRLPPSTGRGRNWLGQGI